MVKEMRMLLKRGRFHALGGIHKERHPLNLKDLCAYPDELRYALCNGVNKGCTNSAQRYTARKKPELSKKIGKNGK